MKFYKRILKNKIFIHCMAGIASGYIRFVYNTSRWKHLYRNIPEYYWQNNKPFICVCWHNRVLMGICGWDQAKPFNMLISKHSDGRLIAQTTKNFGVKVIGGSKNRGGTGALRKLLKSLKKGESVGITPDGPRGPRFEVSDGVMMLAKMSGCDIVSGTYGIKRRKVLKSWDRFIFALPFTKGYHIWGKPLSVPKDATEKDMEMLKKELQRTLCGISNEADHLCGHKTLE